MTNAALVYPDTKLFIDGEWREGRECRTIPVIDPATEEMIGSVAHVAPPDLDAALAGADRGFKLWSSTSAFDRSKLMCKAAGLLRERGDRIAWL